MPQPSRALAFFLLLASPLCLAADPAPAPPGPFPLPSLNGKALAVTEGQKTFRVPLSFARLEKFYRDQFASCAEVALTPSGTDGARVLTLTSKRKGDTWKRAVAREGAADTSVEVTPVLRMDAEKVEGNGKPLVQFVFGRSPEAAKAAVEMDHLEQK